MNLGIYAAIAAVILGLGGAVGTLYYRGEAHDSAAKLAVMTRDRDAALEAAASAKLVAEARQREAAANARFAESLQRQNAAIEEETANLRGALRNAGKTEPEARAACKPSAEQLRLLNGGLR